MKRANYEIIKGLYTSQDVKNAVIRVKQNDGNYTTDSPSLQNLSEKTTFVVLASEKIQEQRERQIRQVRHVRDVVMEDDGLIEEEMETQNQQTQNQQQNNKEFKASMGWLRYTINYGEVKGCFFSKYYWENDERKGGNIVVFKDIAIILKNMIGSFVAPTKTKIMFYSCAEIENMKNVMMYFFPKHIETVKSEWGRNLFILCNSREKMEEKISFIEKVFENKELYSRCKKIMKTIFESPSYTPEVQENIEKLLKIEKEFINSMQTQQTQSQSVDTAMQVEQIQTEQSGSVNTESDGQQQQEVSSVTVRRMRM